MQGHVSATSVTDAVAIVTAWISLGGFSAAGYGSNHQDISKQYSGILFGLSNGLASVAASGGSRCCSMPAPGKSRLSQDLPCRVSVCRLPAGRPA